MAKDTDNDSMKSEKIELRLSVVRDSVQPYLSPGHVYTEFRFNNTSLESALHDPAIMKKLKEEFLYYPYSQTNLYLGYQGSEGSPGKIQDDKYTASDCEDHTLDCTYSSWLEVEPEQVKEWVSYMMERDGTPYHLFSHNCADEAVAALDKIQPGAGEKLMREMITLSDDSLLAYPLAGWYGGYKYGLEREEKFLTALGLGMAVPVGVGAAATAVSWVASAITEVPRCNFPDHSYALKSGLYAATTTSLLAGTMLPALTSMPETAAPLLLPLGVAVYGWYKCIRRNVNFGNVESAARREERNTGLEEGEQLVGTGSSLRTEEGKGQDTVVRDASWFFPPVVSTVYGYCDYVTKNVNFSNIASTIRGLTRGGYSSLGVGSVHNLVDIEGGERLVGAENSLLPQECHPHGTTPKSKVLEVCDIEKPMGKSSKGEGGLYRGGG